MVCLLQNVICNIVPGLNTACDHVTEPLLQTVQGNKYQNELVPLLNTDKYSCDFDTYCKNSDTHESQTNNLDSQFI